MRIVVTTLVLSLAAATSLWAEVRFVDEIGVLPNHFATIQGAVDASSAGDTVLVKGNVASTGEDVVIDGKGISLMADYEVTGISNLVGLRTLVVRNVPAGQVLVLQGLGIGPPPPGPALLCEDNAGSLRFHDVYARGRVGDPQTPTSPARPGGTGAEFTNCADVHVRDSGFSGGDGGDVPGIEELAGSDGGVGAIVTNSKVTCYFSGFGGGDGGEVEQSFGLEKDAGSGGVGLVNVGSTMMVWAEGMIGGSGGDTFSGASGDGGNAYEQSGAGAVMRLYYSTPVAGLAGNSGIGPDGIDGAPQVLMGGQFIPSNTSLTFARDFWTTTPVREGDPLVVTGVGFEDDFWMIAGFEVGNAILPAYEGTLALSPPFTNLIYLGTVPFLATQFPLGPAPDLPLGIDTVQLQVQALLKNSDQEFVLGPSNHIVLVSASL